MPADVFPELICPRSKSIPKPSVVSQSRFESQVTVPMEGGTYSMGVAWLGPILLQLVACLSSILLFLLGGTKFIRARQMVQERLTQAFALPTCRNCQP